MVAVGHLVLATLDEFFTVGAEIGRKFGRPDVENAHGVGLVAARASARTGLAMDIFPVAFQAHACTPISSVWISTLRKK